MLFRVDGLSEEWDGHEGLFDFDAEPERVPFILQRLANPNEQRNYDTSIMGSDFNEHCASSDIE